MNEAERKIYDKYAYNKTFKYVLQVYLEFERRVNSTLNEFDGLKRGECRFDYETWEKRLDITHKCMVRAIKELTCEGVIKQTFKGVKGSSSLYFLRRFEEQKKEQNEEQNEEQKKASRKATCEVIEEQNKEQYEEQKKVHTSKYIYLNIESINNIYSHWNSKKIIIHKNLSSKMQQAISKSLKEYKEEEIKKAIDNYCEVYRSSFYYQHKWDLEKFLKQGNAISRFTDEGDIYNSYLDSIKKNKVVDNHWEENCID